MEVNNKTECIQTINTELEVNNIKIKTWKQSIKREI